MKTTQASFRIEFPSTRKNELDQDEEWFEFRLDGERRRLRLHDYGQIYSVPGLYEALVYEALECRSPEVVVSLLEQAVKAAGDDIAGLRMLDLGAGNGIVGAELRARGVDRIVGIDLLPEARQATQRDRPDVYEDYVVADLTAATPEVLDRLRAVRPNGLVTVAALGFGDVPAEALQKLLDLLPEGGWVALCIKDRFLEVDDDSGFGCLLRRLIADGRLEVYARRAYAHRQSIVGEPLTYVALIARKA